MVLKCTSLHDLALWTRVFMGVWQGKKETFRIISIKKSYFVNWNKQKKKQLLGIIFNRYVSLKLDAAIDPAHTINISLWNGFASSSPEELVHVQDFYVQCQMSRNYVGTFPQLCEKLEKNFTFQQENDSNHATREAHEWIRKKEKKGLLTDQVTVPIWIL